MWENEMRNVAGKLFFVVAMSSLVSAMSVRAEKIELDKLPKAVVDAVKKKFPDAKLTEAAKESDGDGAFYEVSFTYKDHKYDVECKPNGAFRKIEKILDARELPKEVAKVLEKKYPKADLNEILEVTLKDKIAYYEVALVTADKKEVEVQLDPKGKILKEDKKD
jgi:uncharacterized membrane protein YkoI